MIETATLVGVRRRVVAIDDRVVVVAVALAVAALGWLRIPWAARNTVWAEDGWLFLSELTKEGFLQTLFKPYTGYLQFWPRILTELAAQAGLVRFADAITVVSCAAVGALGGAVYVWSRAVVEQPLTRVALAAAPVLVPMAPIEVLGNVANLHWVVLWTCAWLLVVVPRRSSTAIGLGLLACSFALTEIQVAVLVPLLLLHRRSPRAWIVRAGLLAGIAAQLISTLLAPRNTVSDHLELGSIVAGYFVNGPLAAMIGDQSLAGVLLADHGLLVAYIAFVPFLLAFVYCVVHGSSTVRLLVATLLFTSVATWAAALWVNAGAGFVSMFGYDVFTPDQFRSMSYYRYGYVPSLCLLSIGLVAAGLLIQRNRASSPAAVRKHLIGCAALAVFALIGLSSFTATHTLRDGQPLWGPAFVAASATCHAHPNQATAQVAQAPSGWASDLPCRSLG